MFWDNNPYNFLIILICMGGEYLYYKDKEGEHGYAPTSFYEGNEHLLEGLDVKVKKVPPSAKGTLGFVCDGLNMRAGFLDVEYTCWP